MGPAGLRGSSKERLQRGPTGADKQRVRTWEACPEGLEPAVVGSGAALDFDRRDGTSAHGHEVGLGGAVAPVAHFAAFTRRDGRAEVEVVTVRGRGVTAVEVKSGATPDYRG